jgi:hypothetical protein
MKKTMFFVAFIFIAFLLGCEKEALMLPNELDNYESQDLHFRSSTDYDVLLLDLRSLVISLMDQAYLDRPNGSGLLPQLRMIKKRMDEDKMDVALNKLHRFIHSLNILAEAGKIPPAELSIFMDKCEQLEGIIIGVVVLIDENFDSYAANTFPDMGGWTLIYDGKGTPYQVISTEKAVSGSQAFKLEGRPGWAALALKNLDEIPDEIFLEANINTQKSTPGWTAWPEASIYLYNKDLATWGTSYVNLTFDVDNKIQFGASYVPFTYVQDYVDGQWYKVKIKYNRIEDKAWLWINDVLMIEDLDFSGPTGEYNSVALVSGNGADTKSFFDDLKVWYE